MRPFAYERPTRLADAVALLAEHGPDARLLAGGTDLIIRLRDGSIAPRFVVDVKRIGELDDTISEVDGALRIGARTVMTAIAADERVRRDYPALAEAASVVGSVQIRNRATLAGNICNASPAADTAPALLVYGARVVVAGPAGTRTIPIDDVFVRSGVTTLERGELLLAVELPRPPGPRGSVHLRRTRRRGHDLASVTLTCAVTPGRGRPARVRQPRSAAAARDRRDGRPRRSPRPRNAIASRASRSCSPTRARRPDRCARAPSTASRCSTCSASARSTSPSTASPGPWRHDDDPAHRP